jgi:transcription elongation factor GreA
MDNNNQDKIPITQEGLEEIKKDYEELVDVKRPEAVKRVAETRTIGDLTEDNEHLQAKQTLSFIEGKISELGEVIKNAEIINQGSQKPNQVNLGCRVTVEGDGQSLVYHLVGEWEANPAQMKISHQSPLGQSLMGKKVGDQVEVEAPAGKIVYTIKKID